jgi:hypothetical protein
MEFCSMSSVCMNEYHFFDFFLTFQTLFTQVSYVASILELKNKRPVSLWLKKRRVFNRRFFGKKDGPSPHEKVSLFLHMDFL